MVTLTQFFFLGGAYLTGDKRGTEENEATMVTLKYVFQKIIACNT
jgi:hypothetical protein